MHPAIVAIKFFHYRNYTSDVYRLIVLYYSALLEPFSNNKRTNRAPRPLPSVAGAKTKNFPYLSSFLRRGVWGEPTKNGKEIFGFASPLQTTK